LRRELVVLALLATIFSAFVVGRVLATYDFDPSTTIKFGEIFSEQNQYAEDLLGEIVVAPMAGHDGKYFFVQAMDPFYLEPGVHAVYLDRPTYRSQRMAYPTIASLGGLASPTATAWGLIVVNVIAMVVGTIYTGLVATRMGLSALFGLAFLLNPGLLVDLTIDGAGVVAMAAMMAGVYYAMRGALWGAAISLSVASLARETMLIAAVGVAAYLWQQNRRIPWKMVLPFGTVMVWWLYVHWRLEDGLSQDTQALGLPFVGFAQAFQGWLTTSGSAMDLAVGCALLIASMLVVVRSLRAPTLLGWAVSGFALLGTMLSEPVWRNWFDSSRALAPILTAFILLVAAPTDMGAQIDAHTDTSPGKHVRLPHEELL
jgi:hypothetical protein